MKTQITTILNLRDELSAVRRQFLLHLFMLMISLPGRLNFLNLARYGGRSEKTSRRHFEQPLDWEAVNRGLIEQHGSGRYVIAADASFLPKSGKHPPHVGHFWNGCVGKAMHGLEAQTLAVIDLERHTAFHLHTQQTPRDLPEDDTRTQHHVQHIIDQQTTLRHFSPYLVYDNAAAHPPLVNRLLKETDLHLVSKLRCDADLQYLYTGPRRPGPGAPRKSAGKMACAHPDLSRFERCDDDDEVSVYPAVVHSRALKRTIRIASVLNRVRDRYVSLFSTDTTLSGQRIYEYYRARFQIEFLFREAKQYTGLTTCQARSEQKIAFHLHAALTAVSLCRADFYADVSHRDQPFSMHNYQTRAFNQLLLDQFLARLDLDPTSAQVATVYHDLINFGSIAA